MLGSSTYGIYVIDGDAAVRATVQEWLSEQGYRVDLFESADAFLDRVGFDAVGCVLLAARLEGLDGVALMEMLARARSAVKVIMMSGRAGIPDAVRSIRAGALDFLEKPLERETLIDLVQQAVEALDQEQEERQELEVLRDRFESLTPRELTVMEMVVRGMLNKQIADELGLSQKTVEVHRSHVMQKMRAPGLAHLIRMAMKLEAAELVPTPN